MIPILLSILLSAILWRRGGDGEGLFREIGVPVTVALFKAIITHNLYALLYAPMLWVMLKLFSYGITAPPHNFWVWVFGKGEDGNYKPVELATRLTCAVFWLLPTYLFACITGNITMYVVYYVLGVIAIGYIGAYEKDVEISERLIGGIVGFGGIV